MRLSFADIFGTNATQDTEKLTINLSDIGSPTTYQSIFVALLNRCILNGEITGNGQVITANGEWLQFDNSPVTELLNVTYTRNEIKFRDGKQYFASIYKLKILLPGNELTPFNLSEMDGY